MYNYNIEDLLREGKGIQVAPRGWSMYPLLIQGRDQVVIEPCDASTGRRGDVLLYRRNGENSDGGILVLHRVYRHTQEGYWMIGDNQLETEGPLREDQIRGRMTAFIRKGRYHTVTEPGYVLYSHLWLMLRPLRRIVRVVRQKLKTPDEGN